MILVDGATRPLAIDFLLSGVRLRSLDPYWTPDGASAHAFTAPFVLPGTACRSVTPIPPGEYVVQARLPDGSVREGRVRLEHAPTTALALGL